MTVAWTRYRVSLAEPVMNGSPLFAGFRSERDAASVVALRESGVADLSSTFPTMRALTEAR